MSATVPDLSRRLAIAEAAAIEAGAALMAHLAAGVAVEHKGDIDLVSVADRDAEAIVVGAIRAAFPEDALRAEEGGGDDTDRDGLTWFVDPLDGTTNFVHRIPHFAVSVGLAWRGEAVVGVVYDPARGELFRGVVGGGAQLDGSLLRPSTTASLGDALIATGFSYDRRQRAATLMGRLGRAMHTTRGVRRFGAAALDLCWVAAGRFDGYYEDGLSAWDVCAGAAIVTAAGGRVTDFDGGPLDLETPRVLASNGPVHDALAAEVVAPFASREADR